MRLLEVLHITYLVSPQPHRVGTVVTPIPGWGKLRHRGDQEVRGRLRHEPYLPQPSRIRETSGE